jgi:Icc-related predicted phosphoesterase
MQIGCYWIAGLGYSICHAPPKGTALDEIRHGLHAGSSAGREFIDQHQPRWFFCGLIHEAAGRSIEMGRTQAANVWRKETLLEL